MVATENLKILGMAVGGILSANASFSEVYCTVPFDDKSQIDLATLAQAFADCTDPDSPDLWLELIDRGAYQLEYSSPEGDADRKLTGLSHVNWSQDIPLEIGAIFGFRAATISDPIEIDSTIKIVTFPPEGTLPPFITTKQITSNAVEAALFLIGDENLMIPGEWRIEVRHKGRVLAAQRFQLQ